MTADNYHLLSSDDERWRCRRCGQVWASITDTYDSECGATRDVAELREMARRAEVEADEYDYDDFNSFQQYHKALQAHREAAAFRAAILRDAANRIEAGDHLR